MRRWMLFACALLAAGCSGGNGTTSTGASAPPAPPLKNTTAFPLYGNAQIVASSTFTQNVQLQNAAAGSVFAAGSGTYAVREVIASTQAPFAQISAWVSHVTAAPPAGFSTLANAAGEEQRSDVQRYGLDYATFTHPESGKTHGVLVIAMDPQRVNARFGTILSMISRYNALPAMMRAPIDNEAKARFGMSISEATQPDSPIGAALAALDQFEHKHSRGIVVLDAVKR